MRCRAISRRGSTPASSAISPSRSRSRNSWRRSMPHWNLLKNAARPCRYRRLIEMVEAADILNASILVVDDQAANVSLLERMLTGAGYTSITSTMDPHQVCELHRTNRYSLILLDLQMPGLD